MFVYSNLHVIIFLAFFLLNPGPNGPTTKGSKKKEAKTKSPKGLCIMTLVFQILVFTIIHKVSLLKTKTSMLNDHVFLSLIFTAIEVVIFI